MTKGTSPHLPINCPGIVFTDTETDETFKILGERCKWIKKRGWYVRAQVSNDPENEEPEAYAINQLLWDMIIASSELNPTRTICSEGPAQ